MDDALKKERPDTDTWLAVTTNAGLAAAIRAGMPANTGVAPS